jgi:hypothetical protein
MNTDKIRTYEQGILDVRKFTSFSSSIQNICKMYCTLDIYVWHLREVDNFNISVICLCFRYVFVAY